MKKSLKETLTLGEIVRLAHKKTEPAIWDYVIGGSETETTLRRNRKALDEVDNRLDCRRGAQIIITHP